MLSHGNYYDYLAFELLVGAHTHDGYAVTVVHSPAGEGDAICRMDPANDLSAALHALETRDVDDAFLIDLGSFSSANYSPETLPISTARALVWRATKARVSAFACALRRPRWRRCRGNIYTIHARVRSWLPRRRPRWCAMCRCACLRGQPPCRGRCACLQSLPAPMTWRRWMWIGNVRSCVKHWPSARPGAKCSSKSSSMRRFPPSTTPCAAFAPTSFTSLATAM